MKYAIKLQDSEFCDNLEVFLYKALKVPNQISRHQCFCNVHMAYYLKSACTEMIMKVMYEQHRNKPAIVQIGAVQVICTSLLIHYTPCVARLGTYSYISKIVVVQCASMKKGTV
ncbi:hypothetical protein KIL84_011518 [Mauremys mutica]|uniref:Uncharacterized protein n=1 Tax=Mauremys mutica TaxID=74926 RepID=A0A9D3XDS9_9SAUR|nr:hypothetical protein KIL84_011518 [Mauremys mutica]